MSEGKPGRPSKSNSIKSGNSSWAPASLNEFINKEDGYRYRMSRNDPANLAKKAQEGWENVSGIQSANTKHISAERIGDATSLTTVQQGHDWVLQRIPEELAEQRDAYYNRESQRRVEGLTAHVKRDMKDKGGNAPVHGDITISSRGGTQVID